MPKRVRERGNVWIAGRQNTLDQEEDSRSSCSQDGGAGQQAVHQAEPLLFTRNREENRL